MSHQGDVGWVGQPSPLRNLRVGSVTVSEVAWLHAYPGFFKRYRLGWHAELGERLVVIFLFTNPWDYSFFFYPKGVSSSWRCWWYLLLQSFLSTLAREVLRALDEVRRRSILLAPKTTKQD